MFVKNKAQIIIIKNKSKSKWMMWSRPGCWIGSVHVTVRGWGGGRCEDRD